MKILIAITLTTVLFLIPLTVEASPSDSTKVGRIKNQVDGLSRSLDQAAARYEAAYSRLCQTESNIAVNTSKLRKTQRERAFYQKALSIRLCSIYRDGKINLLEVLFQVKSFDEFLNRLNLMKRIGEGCSASH